MFMFGFHEKTALEKLGTYGYVSVSGNYFSSISKFFFF